MWMKITIVGWQNERIQIMTYKELIEICYKTPVNCMDCKYRKEECKVFRNETGFSFPGVFYPVLNLDLDSEIEVKE